MLNSYCGCSDINFSFTLLIVKAPTQHSMYRIFIFSKIYKHRWIKQKHNFVSNLIFEDFV